MVAEFGSVYFDCSQYFNQAVYFSLEGKKLVDDSNFAFIQNAVPGLEISLFIPEDIVRFGHDIFQLMGRAMVYLDPGRAEEAIVKYTSLSNKFIDTQRDLRNEQARRTLLLAANQHQAKIKQREELQSIRSNHNVERWVTFGGVVLFIFIAYQAFRYFQKKRMWRRAMEVTKNRNPTLSE